MKRNPIRLAALVLVLLLGVVASPFFCAIAPGGSGVIARLEVSGEGTFLLTQEWTGWYEPYQVEFWFLPSGEEEWLFEIIDFEQLRWYGAELRVSEDQSSVLVYEGSKLWAKFDLEEHTFRWARQAENEPITYSQPSSLYPPGRDPFDE